jgi:(R,R)-butanediol dehydrogenase/meso-butanediol dehydrogenase/diacetyl reductase
MVRPGGTVLQVGIAAEPQPIEMRQLVLREVTIRTSLAHVCGEDLGPALHILATTSVGSELLDSVHPLDDITEQLDRLVSGELEGKVLFAPGS